MKKILAILFLMVTHSAYAASWWNDLWQTRDQQAESLLSSHPGKSAQLFKNPSWKAVAHYRSGQYQEAAEKWSSFQSIEGYYNQGNALAHLGQYPEAIKAYEQALKLKPDHQDAAYNKALLEKLMQQKKQEKQNQKENQKQEQKKSEQQEKDSKDQKSSEEKKSQQDKQKSQTPKQKAATKKQEKQQADQQWLKQVPDDPGGLLQHKFWRDHQRYKEQGYDG